MSCDYCFGVVKVVDRFQSFQTVECLSCGVRYDVEIMPKMSNDGVDKVLIETENKIYKGLGIFIK